MSTNTNTEQTAGKRRGGSVWTWVIGAAVLFAFYESIILLLVGMAPTFVAMITDRSAQRNRARTVAYLNFAGCLPWAIEYWIGGGGFDRVFDMLGDPYVLLVMYAAAGAGWLLYFSIRPVVASYLAVSSEIKQTQLKKKQEKLVEQWGEDVRKDAFASGLIEPVPEAGRGDPESVAASAD